MISKKTVFVLGAGASKPFGFPTGFELREQICSFLQSRSSASILLEKNGFLPSPRFSSFVNSFLMSSLNSIDAFMSRNPSYADIGTAAIAACLMMKEDASIFNYVGGKVGNSDWYGLLWNCLVDQIIDITQLRQKNDISFITFNYDRSLEAFLLQAAMSTFGINAERAAEFCKQFHIYHMYGSLGKFNWQDQSSYGLPSDDLNQSRAFRAAAEGIKVVPAQRQETFDETAKAMLQGAQQVAFLGFGFDGSNCARLGLPYALQSEHEAGLPRKVFMTATGMSGSEINRAVELIGWPSSLIDGPVNINVSPCYTALREWGILLG